MILKSEKLTCKQLYAYICTYRVYVMHIYKYTHFVCMYIYIYVHIYCVYMCIYICIYVCICVYTHIWRERQEGVNCINCCQLLLELQIWVRKWLNLQWILSLERMIKFYIIQIRSYIMQAMVHSNRLWVPELEIQKQIEGYRYS